ncbi:XopAW family type III secretion system calcium-binding effector [Roseateles asaccharophilus]|uniref:Ca2+-binding EF-hand superfamily protein n=1 Tax=Roseateles asaccharophilus TaxID=582607 RepID=A0ABU2A575_9BURK|nr:XopAW family type III secretion system calcium-binding effector [Roseateles asaccharophilus]MDR7332296.1 Ca2+-binding EF-hand superfamily protein [Roseateles asaccharophilus]
MSTISGLGGVNRSWDSGASRKAEHEARMFAKVDSDGSGGVDATELATMLEHTGQSGDSAELLKQMDGNGDGSLSSDELSQGMRELMPPPASTMEFAQSRGAANDEVDVFAELDADGDGQLTRAEFEAGRPSGPPPGGMPPPAASSSGASATSTETDPLDLNQDGTVSEIERLAGELKALAQSANDESAAANPLNTEIAQLAQKLYDQIARNWLQPAATATQVSTTA